MSSENTVKIDKKITGFAIKKEGEVETKVQKEIVHIQKPLLERDETLTGSTYKIKPPLSEHAFYITINDVIVEEDGEKERKPFEIFINTKNMEHYMWIVALTRVISAIFRKGDDINFLVEELKSVFDPRGGYYKKGGKYVNSLVAEIGLVIEEHLKNIGSGNVIDDNTAKFIEKKKAEFKEKNDGKDPLDNAMMCKKCNEKAVIRLDNCMTCLECGDSKCG